MNTRGKTETVGRMSMHGRVCTHSVCTLSVCVSKSAPKAYPAGTPKHKTVGRAANTVGLPQVNSSSIVLLLLLLLLLCAKLHTQTYVNRHMCVQSVGTLGAV